MKLIRVRAGGPQTGNVVFDQAEAGVHLGKAARVIIRANGNEHMVNGALKVVKEAIERGDLLALDPIEPDAPTVQTGRAEK